ncbi:MAG: DUF6108 family protein [Clostridium sp.]|nr:DUF6108 family protein [Clostridium sp.]
MNTAHSNLSNMHNMKNLAISILFWLAASLLALAQEPLQISKIFNGKYASDPAVTETMISGSNEFLYKHNLTLLSTFKAPADKYAAIIEPLVLKDADKTIGKNISYKKGILHYAFFMLKPADNARGRKINRFLYYINNQPQGGKNIMVLYFEGSLGQNGANSLIKSMSKKIK